MAIMNIIIHPRHSNACVGVANGVARIFVWGGGAPGTFSLISPFSVISITGSDYQIQWGGVVAEIVPVDKSITFPRFRDIFGPPADHPPFVDTSANSGSLSSSAYTFKPRNNINSFQKKTFTKSLGGATGCCMVHDTKKCTSQRAFASTNCGRMITSSASSVVCSCGITVNRTIFERCEVMLTFRC